MINADGYAHIVDPQLKNNSILTAVELTSSQPFSINLSCDKTEVAIGDLLTYTAIIKNNLSEKSEDFTLVVSLPVNTSFIANSFTVDGLAQIDINPCSPYFNIGFLSPNEKKVITLATRITDYTSSKLHCSFSGVFDHFFPCSNCKEKASICSNIVSTTILTTSIVNQLSKKEIISKNSTSSANDYNIISAYLLKLDTASSTSKNDIILFDVIPQGINAIPKSIFLPKITSSHYSINLESYFKLLEETLNVKSDIYLDVPSILEHHNLI